MHHRFLRRGFSQRRAAVTIWAWCLSLARGRVRDALRPVPRARRLAPVVDARSPPAIGLVAVLFSVYVVYVLEIVKLGNPIQRRRRADDPLKKTA